MPSRVAVYEIKRTFHAPLPYAYEWCTDYTEKDRQLQGDPGERQLIRRTPRTAIYEDLNETPNGWMWSRQTVTLLPPDRWNAIAEGNYRTWKLEYSLKALSRNRCQFTMRGERRATALGVRNPAKKVLERELHGMWRNLGHALERDYRASQRKVTR